MLEQGIKKLVSILAISVSIIEIKNTNAKVPGVSNLQQVSRISYLVWFNVFSIEAVIGLKNKINIIQPRFVKKTRSLHLQD